MESDYIYTTGMSFLYENALNPYYIYPNPSSNWISIQSESPFNNKFVILDQQGREMINGMLLGNRTDVSLEKLANGAYTVRIEGDFKPQVVIKQ